MLYIYLFISILCFFLWVNILIAEFLNIKANPYSQNYEEEKKTQTQRAKFKIALIIIFALTFAATIFVLL